MHNSPPPQTEEVACPHAKQTLQMGYDLLGKYVAQNHILMQCACKFSQLKKERYGIRKCWMSLSIDYFLLLVLKEKQQCLGFLLLLVLLW
jgi:hypothetical protein